MRRRLILAAAASASALALSGCGTFEPVQTSGGGSRTLGRFSAVSSFQGKTRTDAGSFSLTETPDLTALDLGHPVTGTLARITVKPGLARLTESSGKTHEAPDAETLMTRLLGFGFPVRELSGWLSSASGGDEISRGGWTIRTVKRDEKGLPKLIRAEKPENSSSPAVKLTVTADERHSLR